MIDRDHSKFREQLEIEMVKLPQRLRTIASNVVITGLSATESFSPSLSSSESPSLWLKCERAKINRPIPHRHQRGKQNQQKRGQKESKSYEDELNSFRKNLTFKDKKQQIILEREGLSRFSLPQRCQGYLNRSLSTKAKEMKSLSSSNKSTCDQICKSENPEDNQNLGTASANFQTFYSNRCKSSLRKRLHRVFEDSQKEENKFYETTLSIKSSELHRKFTKLIKSQKLRPQNALKNCLTDPETQQKREQLRPWRPEFSCHLLTQSKQELRSYIDSWAS